MLVPRSSCGYCHRRDGTHSKGCKKKACKFCTKFAPKKCRFHAGHQASKPGPKGRRLHRKGAATFSGSDQYLDKIRAEIVEHERKAAVLREALFVLEG